MDPERVDAIAGMLSGAIASLESVSARVDRLAWASLDPLTYGIQPGGLIIAPTAIAGTVWAAASVRGAAGSVRELVDLLCGEALDQRAASAGVGSARGHGRAVLRHPSTVDLSDPQAVAAWWATLDGDEKAGILSNSPSTVANLDGIPFVDRIEAHKRWAELRLQDPSFTTQERTYLQHVVTGEVQLILYDPENDRIIEAIGDLGQPASRVVTYVPGTDAKLGDFYDNKVQKVGRYLESQLDSTVVLVYKDGPWAQWIFGDRGNANPNSDYSRDRGVDLAHFQDVVELEPSLADASTVAISHSWGTTAMTNAEVAGAHYDTVISLSGAYVPEAWQPQAGSDYYYLRYDVDALTNAERLGGRSPQNAGGWKPRVFDSGAIPLGDSGYVLGNGGDNHDRISRDVGDNAEPLLFMRELLRGLS